MPSTHLKQLRAEVDITQEAFSQRSGVKMKTYRAAEWGNPVTNKTAQLILTGMNNLRIEKGLSVLKLEDLGISLY